MFLIISLFLNHKTVKTIIKYKMPNGYNLKGKQIKPGVEV